MIAGQHQSPATVEAIGVVVSPRIIDQAKKGEKNRRIDAK
jgi:hypothetical protein